MAQCYAESSKPIGGTFDMYGGAFTGRLYCSGYGGGDLKHFHSYAKYNSTIDQSNVLKPQRDCKPAMVDSIPPSEASTYGASRALTLYKAAASDEAPKPPASRDGKSRTSGELVAPRRGDACQKLECGRSGNPDCTNKASSKSGSSSQRSSGEIVEMDTQSTKSSASSVSSCPQDFSPPSAKQGASDGSLKATNTPYQSWPSSPANLRPAARTRNLSEGSFSLIFPDESPRSSITSPGRQRRKEPREFKLNAERASLPSSRGRLSDSDAELNKVAPSGGVSRGTPKRGEVKARTKSYAGSPPRTSTKETSFIRHSRNVSDGNWTAFNSLKASKLSSKSSVPTASVSKPQVVTADKGVAAPVSSTKLNKSSSEGSTFITGGSFSRVSSIPTVEKPFEKPPELPVSSFGNISRANSAGYEHSCNKKVPTESYGAGNVYLMGESMLLKKALASKDPEEVKSIGNEQYKKGHFVEALSLYDRAISLSRGQAPYHGNKAAALAALGRLAEAVQQCQEALLIDPNYSRAHQRLGALFIRLGRVEDAKKHFRAAGLVDAESNRQMETIATHFAKCYEARKLRDWPALLKHGEAVITVGADSSVQAYALKAEAFLNLNKLNEAEKAVAFAKKLGSGAVRPKYLLDERVLFIVQAQIDMAQGRFEEATSAAEKAIMNEPYNSEVSEFEKKVRRISRARTIGNDLFKAGKYFEASAAYSEGLELDPTSAIFLCNRAACRSKLRLWEKAVEDCNAALNIQPDYAKALLRRAQCNSQLERWEEALRDYEVLKGKLPGDVEIARALFDAQVAHKRSRGEEVFKPKFGGEIEEVYSSDQFKEAITSPGLAVVHFITRWSERCKQITPFIDDLSKRYPSVSFVKVDIESHPFLARTEHVGSVPTFKVYKNGHKMTEMLGPSQQKLEDAVQHYIL